MAKRTKVDKPLTNSKFEYELIVSIDGKVDIFECNDPLIPLVDIKPKKINGKVIVSLSNGRKRIEKVLYPARAKRLFFNPLFAQFFIKNLKLAI